MISGLAATGGNQVFKQAVKLFCKQHGLDYHVVKMCLPSDGTEDLEDGAELPHENDHPANNENN